MADSWIQWEGVSVGGPMAATTLLVHKACGAFVADRERHEKVCTAPPWEPAPVNIGEIHDFNSDGSST